MYRFLTQEIHIPPLHLENWTEFWGCFSQIDSENPQIHPLFPLFHVLSSCATSNSVLREQNFKYILCPKKSNHDVNQREKGFAVQLPVFLPEMDYYQLHEEVHHIFP